MLLHRVWVVSQQHGNVIHAHMLLQKFDGKGISKHVRLGLDAFALLALHAKRPRRRLTALHKLFWIALRTFWSGWTEPLILVTPRTVVSLGRIARIGAAVCRPTHLAIAAQPREHWDFGSH